MAPHTVLHVEGSWDLATCPRLHSHVKAILVDILQAFGVFGLCQIHAFLDYIRSKLSRAQFDTLFWSFVILVTSTAVVVGGTLTFLGSKFAFLSCGVE